MERRTITTRQASQQQVGSTRIAPGIWRDADGHVHWSVPELLALVDLPDTLENREAVVAILEKGMAGHVALVVRQDVQDG